MEAYLPIIYVRALLGPLGNTAQRERLIQRVQAALRSEDQVSVRFQMPLALERDSKHAQERGASL
jgi:hypothetical protein